MPRSLRVAVREARRASTPKRIAFSTKSVRAASLPGRGTAGMKAAEVKVIPRIAASARGRAMALCVISSRRRRCRIVGVPERARITPPSGSVAISPIRAMPGLYSGPGTIAVTRAMSTTAIAEKAAAIRPERVSGRARRCRRVAIVAARITQASTATRAARASALLCTLPLLAATISVMPRTPAATTKVAPWLGAAAEREREARWEPHRRGSGTERCTLL